MNKTVTKGVYKYERKVIVLFDQPIMSRTNFLYLAADLNELGILEKTGLIFLLISFTFSCGFEVFYIYCHRDYRYICLIRLF